MSVQRVIKTPEQVKILDELYERGMTSYGRDHKEVKKLIEEAVERTGLTAQQIKVIFANENVAVYFGSNSDFAQPRREL